MSMSIPFFVSSRSVDPFGLDSILGDYDRQMRHMMRELNRMESQFQGGAGEGCLPGNNLISLLDRNSIAPRIVDQNGQKAVQYNFDIKGFRPEDVHIKTTNGRNLVVSAKHEDKGEDHHAIREFKRSVTLPEGMQLEGMKSRVNPNGVLTISAPYSPPAIEQKKDLELPIHHEKEPAAALK